jgi:hypothetical protein
MFQPICYHLLLVTNKLFSYIHYWKCKLIGNKPIKMITTQIENIYWWKEYIHCCITNSKIEPFDDYWISTRYITKNGSKSSLFVTKETYIYPNTYEITTEMVEDTMNTCFKNIYKKCLYKLEDSANIRDFLIIMKSNHVKNVKICSITNKDNLLRLSNDYSDVRFLTIQYTHPKMNYTININLPNDYFICNNEILSNTFVKMWLEHQPIKYEYDMNYLIKIIDYNINQIDLTSNQFIVIYKNQYNIIDNTESTIYKDNTKY